MTRCPPVLQIQGHNPPTNHFHPFLTSRMLISSDMISHSVFSTALTYQNLSNFPIIFLTSVPIFTFPSFFHRFSQHFPIIFHQFSTSFPPFWPPPWWSRPERRHRRLRQRRRDVAGLAAAAPGRGHSARRAGRFVAAVGLGEATGHGTAGWGDRE